MSSKISAELVDRACVAGDFADRVGMRRALEAVADELGAHEPEPFVLTRDEELAYHGREPYGPSARRIDALKGALARVRRTLGPQPAPAVDPVAELLAEMADVCDNPREGSFSLQLWRDKLEAALAQKAAQ